MVTLYLEMLLNHIYSTPNILLGSYLALFDLSILEQQIAANGRENSVFDIKAVIICG